MRKVVSVLAAALSAAAGIAPATVPAQQPSSAQGEVQLSTREVLLDLVATDKKGHPITDLKPGELEVYENGERQQVTSFGLVRIGPPPKGAVAAPAAATAAPAAIANSPFSGVNLIMIVVDRTSVQAGNLAQVYKAAETFVNQRLAVNDLVAVFATTNRPILLQNFTNNKARLIEALKKATAGTSVQLQEATGDAARADLVRVQSEEGRTETHQTDERADEQRNQLLTDNARGIDTAFANLRDQIQTLAVINSVLALTNVYGRVPGRKSIVLYSEGFVVNNDTKAPFEAMIGAANRANFTVNTVAAGGLEARAPTGAVLPRRARPIEETDDRMAVSGGESGLDRMVKPNLTNNDEALSRLAKETGGVLVRNTNDLGKGFDAIENDLRSYYALSYAPTKAEYDGSFRAIEVRVARKDVEVRARKGYYAVPGGGAILLPYEQPVLAMLSSKAERPVDLRVAMKTERFPSTGTWRVPLVLAVEGGNLAPLAKDPKDPKNNKETADTTDFEADAVALVRDSSGAVVAKLSRASYFRATKDRLAEFRTQMLPLTQFPQPLMLTPGAYTFQVGVYDPSSKKGTVIERKITLPALPPDGAPALSSLVLSTVAAGLAADEREAAANDPLVVDGKTRIVPNATGQFAKSKGDRLIAFFRLHAAPNTKYEMLLHFMIGNEIVLGTAPQPLPPTDADGLTTASPVLPLDGFKPGSYRAVLYIVPPGSNQPVATATTPFTVEP